MEEWIQLAREIEELRGRLDRLKIPEQPLGRVWDRYMLLPGLRGFWPMSPNVAATSGRLIDVSGQARHLDSNGDPVFGFTGKVPYVEFDGTGDYFDAVDSAGVSISGAESYMEEPGLTLGAWVYPTDLTAAQVVLDKFYTSGQYGYSLALQGATAGDPVSFTVSGNGTAYDQVNSASGYASGAWQFMVGRFNDADTGEELAVWLNDEKTTDTTTIASIHDGTDKFGLGGEGGGGNLLTGKISLAFLCAYALPDATIEALYRSTRGLFGV